MKGVDAIGIDYKIQEQLKEMLFDSDGSYILPKFSELAKFAWSDIRGFMHFQALYSLPTVEAVDFLDDLIGDVTAIGICSGRALWETELGMIATDSMIQRDNPEVKAFYELMQQPLITYPKFVEKLDGNQAVKKYRPHTVFGSYITPKKNAINQMGNYYGVTEEDIIANCKRYIKIGTIETHGGYSACKLPHQRIVLPELITRSNRGDSRIFVWSKDGLIL